MPILENSADDSIYLSTAYLPPIDYLLAIATCREAYIDTAAIYTKQSYCNRCEIATPQGLQALVVPAVRPLGHKTPVKAVEVGYDTPWQRDHLGALRTAYGRTPYFIHYYDGLAAIIASGYRHLHDLNAALLAYLLDAFAVDTPVKQGVPASAEGPSLAKDLREAFHPKRKGPCGYSYYQVFIERTGFIGGLSGVDLLMNEGPEGLRAVALQQKML